MDNKEIYLIIGHRGTGKTTWAAELERYFAKKNKKILIFDVDQEMQKNTHLTIDQMFEKGESYLRKIENEIAKDCIQKAQSFKGKTFISLGAGYTGEIPSCCKVIHLKRLSDQHGRIFFDRPRVLSHLTPFDEYQSLYSKRKSIYKQQRDFVFTKLDYFKSIEKWDRIFLGEEKLPFENGVLTLNERVCPSSQGNLNFFLDQKLKWGLKYFELRDDEVSEIFLKKVLLKISLEQVLFSFRRDGSLLFQNLLSQKNIKNIKVDWPLELNVENKIKDPENISWIYSLHKRENKSLSEVLNQFPAEKNVHLKLAVEIFSFEELRQGHLWQKEDPAHRSFHPRSQDGRWKWYRLLFGPHQPLYFIREDDEEGVLDQPVMAESVRFGYGVSKNGFACVLGSPIEHSATPFEQSSFFEQYNLPVVPILMREEEVNNKNIKILEDFGMKFSAITSPLKKKFYQVLNAEKISKNSVKVISNKSSVPSLNTLILTKKGWAGWNTDVDGALAFRQFIHQSECHNVAVWGGGAIRDVLDFVLCLNKGKVCGVLEETAINDIINTFQSQCDKSLKFQNKQLNRQKDISFYSARTGKLLKGKEQSPDIVIWAVGRSRMSKCLSPPQNWRPLYVLDLNYTDDSPGRGYSVKTKSQYISGWLWFKAQAQAQRNIFEKLKA